MRRGLLALSAAFAFVAACGGGELLGTIVVSDLDDASPPDGASPPDVASPPDIALLPESISALDGAFTPDGAATPAGSVPVGLPQRLLVGLYASHGDTWMKASGVPWDARCRFFTRGWYDNFGYGPNDGSWLRSYLDEAKANGHIPGVAYMVLSGQPGNDSLAKIQNPATMADYFTDFKRLLQIARNFRNPMVVMLENTEFAHIERAAKHDPTLPAAVASSGLPELADLPNTVAGWGLAFLRLRRSVGAMNVKLAIDVATWASDLDIAVGDVAVPLEPEVDRVWGFLSRMGLLPNITGDTYDLLSQHVSVHDFDYTKLVQGRDIWWDASEAASVNSRSFNRYITWLSLWNQKAGRRWVLWEIPVGNSNSLNEANTGQPRGGYRDNRAEWVFGLSGAPHRDVLAKAGVGIMFFGLASTAQASVVNDYYTDGQLFMKSRAGAFLLSGGLVLP